MRAAIFDPYLDTLGGGERYVMTVAQTLVKNGWDVDVEWNESELPVGRQGIIKKLEARLGLDLSGVRLVNTSNKGKGYDLVFWLSDGSIPTLWAKKNILHFQVPFHNVSGKSLFNRLKLKLIHAVICNSKFTKRFIDKEYGVNSFVIYPPVDVESFKPLKKQNIILSVGRFSQLLQAKRQDILVSVFKQMVDSGLKGFRLILAGGSDVGAGEYVENLRKQVKDYRIEIIENPDFKTLNKLYGKAKIFWSASGFGVDEDKEAEKVEHFGISVVEAMAAGCVPIVVRAGGHKEIINDPENGILWSVETALFEKTLELIRDNKKREWLSQNGRRRAKDFSVARFENEIKKLIA